MPTRSGRQFNRAQLVQNQQQRRFRRVENIHEGRENVQRDIEQIYTNVKSIPSYSSKILDFLRTNETASVHKRIIRKFRRRQTVAHYPFDSFSMVEESEVKEHRSQIV